ncbi:MAG TPA: Rieske (2Fe-2S) protein [Draconibacterium sp.]|nr:Rieske (2Fe-2S) protein [Draconibacterium sp.]
MNTRRTFLQTAVAGFAALFLFFWNKITLQHLNTTTPKKYSFPFNKNKLVTFDDEFIVISQSETKVYSAHCTHLGCRIDKMEGNRLICPCHGSEYDLNGKVMKGPAYKNLTELKAQISEDGKTITIES